MTGSNDMHTCPKCGQPLRPTALFCPDCGTAVLSSVSNALQISIEQMLATMKPGQAEVLRRCAIPRWFDDEILSVLRERNNDAQNQKILDQLKTYSFVRELGDGRYSYSEDVRNYLLDDWRKRPDDLRPIQKRLYNYFDARMGSTNLENRASWKREVVTYDLLLASTTAVKDQQNTNEDNMWIMTRSTVDARVDRALLKFRAAFEEAFNAHRMAEAEALLVAAEEQVNILAPRIRSWLLYYRGKMNFANLKLDQAQFRELEAFSKFGSDLDEATKFVLDKGRRNVEILKQGQNKPVSVEKQVAIIYCGTKGLLRNVPVEKVKAFEEDFFALLENSHKDVLDNLRNGVINDSITDVLEKVAKDLSSRYA